MPRHRPLKFEFIKQNMTPYTFYKTVDRISKPNRLRFIKNNITIASLIRLYKTVFFWQRIKKLMPGKDAVADLKNLVLSKEEIEAKAILKNIKNDIIKTEWADVNDEEKSMFYLGNGFVTVPNSVARHVEQLMLVSKHEISPTLALATIRIYGYKEYQSRLTTLSEIKSVFFDKNKTEQYFDKFRNEATFIASFGKSNNI